MVTDTLPPIYSRRLFTPQSAAIAEGVVECIASGMNSAVHDAGAQIRACDALVRSRRSAAAACHPTN